MKTLEMMIQTLCQAGRCPEETIRSSVKETGKPAVAVSLSSFQRSWSMLPGSCRWGYGGAFLFPEVHQYIQSLCCSIMRANLELGLSGKYDMLKAALIPSQCDTLKCVCENFKVAVPKVPSSRHLPNNRTIQASPWAVAG